MTDNMTKKERAVFDLLLDRTTVSREDMLVHVWGIPLDVAPMFKTRTVDMTVSRLKRKLPESMEIKNVRGFGYRLLVG